MAAKNLEQALFNANIDIEIKKTICVGPLHELKQRIEIAEAIIIENIKNELRDYFGHKVLVLGVKATALELFNEVFKDVPAFKGEKK